MNHLSNQIHVLTLNELRALKLYVDNLLEERELQAKESRRRTQTRQMKDAIRDIVLGTVEQG